MHKKKAKFDNEIKPSENEHRFLYSTRYFLCDLSST